MSGKISRKELNTDLNNELDNFANSINDLAGEGRTTETVKGNADSLAAHLADEMPHHTTDPGTGKVYRWGLAIQNGEWGILYEEVV